MREWVDPISRSRESPLFETILVAVDHSDHSHRAFQAAKQLAKSTGGKVRVVHIRETLPGRTGPVPDFTDQDAILVEESIRELVQEGVAASGVVYDSHHARRVAAAILEEAEDSGASMIVIGSRGLSDLIGLVVGSTTHKVLHLGTLPVLVVR
jgi:nucleotide-binding universal stress UspA family protein